MMENVGEEFSRLFFCFKDGSFDDKSTLATRGLPYAAGLFVVAGTTFGGWLPTLSAITSATFTVAGVLGDPLGGGGNGYCT
jgi:hypothetical protein